MKAKFLQMMEVLKEMKAEVIRKFVKPTQFLNVKHGVQHRNREVK